MRPFQVEGQREHQSSLSAVRPQTTGIQRALASLKFIIVTSYYKNKNWLQFLFIVKAAVLKQQISKFYPQILSTEASDHIYISQRPFINVKGIFCA